MKIGIDLDGVLCDFVSDYNRTLAKVTGRDLFPMDYVPDCWDYPLKVGYTRDDMKRAEHVYTTDPNFWLGLKALPGIDALFSLSWDGQKLATDWHDLYFITHRPGLTAKSQSEVWLQVQGVVLPTVLVSQHKGSLCAALGIDAFIDDNVNNVDGVMNLSPSTRAYCMVQPWNVTDPRIAGMRKVWSVKEFLTIEGLL